MRTILFMLVVAVAVVACIFGCSQETRDDIWEAVKGDSEKTPRVVRDQQRKERIRQNNTWTPENIALHPIEYCQATLEDLQQRSRNLEARAHEKGCAIAAVKREIADNEAMEKNLAKFIEDAKKVYKECEAANSWPATLGGFTFSREKTQEKIVDAAQKLASIRAKAASRKNWLVKLEKTLKTTQDEQKRIVKIRETVQNVINDRRIKNVVESDDSTVAILNEIEDSMCDLGANYDDPSIETIIQPDENAVREELFKQIMAE